jgi:hypothetical protein
MTSPIYCGTAAEPMVSPDGGHFPAAHGAILAFLFGPMHRSAARSNGRNP